jgi:hypothetical protein
LFLPANLDWQKQIGKQRKSERIDPLCFLFCKSKAISKSKIFYLYIYRYRKEHFMWLATVALHTMLGLSAASDPTALTVGRGDGDALLAAKDRGGGGDDFASWRAGTDPCGLRPDCEAASGARACAGGWRGVRSCVRGRVIALELGNTNIAGNVAAFAPLVQLKSLALYRTQMGGQLAGLAPLTQLTRLELWRTGVEGDVVGLSPLVQLRGVVMP